MPRFSDEWVIDKSLFEYLNGGQCACCSNMNLFLPDGVEGMIQSISDLETDAADNEIKSLNSSPWPPNMRQEVWGDRVKLRLKLKKEIPLYKSFWNEHGSDFTTWMMNSVSPKRLQKILQLPRSEIMEKLQASYKIGRHKGFGVVLAACMEQVANFGLTKYPVDARGDESEQQFEELLTFDRRGGFTVRVCNKDGSRNEETVRVLLNRIESLGFPKLLERAPKKAAKDDEDSDEDDSQQDDDDDDKDDNNNVQTGPSFRSDRRLVRLLVARYWADSLMEKFHADQAENKDDDEG